MYYTYVLKSKTYGSYYYGSSENPEKRLEEEHNKGRVRYTKGRMPWELIYKKQFETRLEAMRFEKFLKSGQGRLFIKKLLR